MVENLDVFFVDFGETVTVNGASVTAIFDNAYIDPLGVAATGPQVTVKTADVSAVTSGATAVVRSVTYKVRGIEPDGTGITVLKLERQ